MSFQWSPSKLIDYRQCPKQFFHRHIEKDIPFKETEQMVRGRRDHKTLEIAIKDGLPVDSETLAPVVTAIRNMPGKKVTEQKLAISEDLEIVRWFDSDVWGRAIVDLTCLHPGQEFASIIDYKSGKVPKPEYYDTTQIIINSLMVMQKYPKLEQVSSAYLYTSHNKGSKIETVSRAMCETLWADLRKEVRKIEDDHRYLPSPSGLCFGWCSVVGCRHWKEKR